MCPKLLRTAIDRRMGFEVDLGSVRPIDVLRLEDCEGGTGFFQILFHPHMSSLGFPFVPFYMQGLDGVGVISSCRSHKDIMLGTVLHTTGIRLEINNNLFVLVGHYYSKAGKSERPMAQKVNLQGSPFLVCPPIALRERLSVLHALLIVRDLP